MKERNAKGELTRYALRCGYVQCTGVDASGRYVDKGAASAVASVELYSEHGTYHVRSFDHGKRDNGAPLAEWRRWQSFASMAHARKHYRTELRRIRGKVTQ